MSQRQDFECPRCGYQETICGGMAFGLGTVLVTISCRDCARLFDTVADQKSQKVHEAGIDAEDVEPAGLTCPQDARHLVSLWKHGGPCPQCGTAMAAGTTDLDWD